MKVTNSTFQSATLKLKPKTASNGYQMVITCYS